MKKDYTLKIVLAMLVVVLVSLVSFAGVYKGRNLLKDYSLGTDFKGKQMATFKVSEESSDNDESTEDSSEENAEGNAEEKTEENTEENKEGNAEGDSQQNDVENNGENSKENPENENSSEENNEESDKAQSDNEKTAEESPEEKSKKYKQTKNIIEKRLASMEVGEYNIRVNEQDGSLAIELPQDMDPSYFSQVVAKGKAQILNQSTNEVLVESNGFKDVKTKLDTTSYSTPVVLIKVKFTKDAKNMFKNVNTNYTDSDGNETEATFAFSLDGQTLYTDNATSFVETAKNGNLDLIINQSTDEEEIKDDYQNALILASIIKNGEIPVEYNLESTEIIHSNVNIKTIIIISVIAGVLMLIYAMFKFKQKAILPVISLVGLVATILLVLRYTNVKITGFTVLGIAILTIANYILILKCLKNKKSFKENFIRMLDVLIPCFIIAIVFCCAPYLNLATLGMTIFWGTIVMIVYNAVITRILINK